MHFQFLIEDESTRILVETVMQKIVGQDENTQTTYDCKAFRGIGGFRKASRPQRAKTQKLLNDLPIYLRGFDKSLQAPGFKAALIIVLDNDQNDPQVFRRELEALAAAQKISVDHVFCIAVEEMEAWLLGDRNAVLQAYPDAKVAILHEYEQDSICGTWEKLAVAIYPGGINRLRKDCTAYSEIGAKKCEWAARIGEHMDIHRNLSPSFQMFVQAIESRLDI